MEQQAVHDYLYKVSVKVESDQSLILIKESLFSMLKIFSNLASKVLFLLHIWNMPYTDSEYYPSSSYSLCLY